jgi:signal transduction histidine kinase
LNEALSQSHEKLKQLYNTAHQFVDNVSHEFRTPLTVTKEFASILSEQIVGPLNEEQMDFANIIINRVEDLSHMVDDMLDISKIEADLLSVCRVEISADDIASGVMMTLERKGKASRVLFEANIPSDLPKVFCDPENVRRVIINLVVNACKFSDEGGRIVLWAKHDAGCRELRFGVTDEGPGISREHVEAIFERFNQGGTGLKASSHGFGLGLSIARELVQANFGTISVQSEVGKGEHVRVHPANRRAFDDHREVCAVRAPPEP